MPLTPKSLAYPVYGLPTLKMRFASFGRMILKFLAHRFHSPQTSIAMLSGCIRQALVDDITRQSRQILKDLYNNKSGNLPLLTCAGLGL